MRFLRVGSLSGTFAVWLLFACGARSSLDFPLAEAGATTTGDGGHGAVPISSGGATTSTGGTRSIGAGGQSSGGSGGTLQASAGSATVGGGFGGFAQGGFAQGGTLAVGGSPVSEGGTGACASGCGGGSVCQNGVCLCVHGQHACSGICVDNDSSDHCGAACTPCVAPAHGTTAPCDGNACNYTCDAGFTSCEGGCLDFMTDPRNCGSCTHDCLGGTCEAGVCQPFALAENQQNPLYIAVGATSLYWTLSSGAVLTMPIAGGTPKTLYPGGSGAEGIALDDRYLYWSTYFGGTILRMPLAGGTVDTLLTTDRRPIGVAVDANNLYFSTFYGAVMQLPLAGGAPTTIYPESTTFCSGVAVNTTDLFLGTYSELYEIPLGGGMALPFATGKNNVFGVALDNDAVYFVEQQGSPVFRAALSDGTVTTIIPAGFAFYGGGIAVDARSIYWIGSDSKSVGTIYRLAK